MREGLLNFPDDARSVAVIATQLAAPNDPQEEHFQRAISILENADYQVILRYQERSREKRQDEESSRRTFEALLAEKAFEVDGPRKLGQTRMARS